MNYAMNDLCKCSNCAGEACQCGCQLAATASTHDATRNCACGPTCGCAAEQGCMCNEWTSY